MNSLALSSNQAIASFNYSFLNNLIKQVSHSDPEIRDCLIMNQHGIAVAHSNQAQVGEKMDGEFFQQVQNLLKQHYPVTINSNNVTPVTFLTQPDIQIMEVVTPVYNGSSLWGALRCAYSLQSLNEQIAATEDKWQQGKNQFTLIFQLVVAAFLVLGITASLFFTKRFERAVGKIIYGVGAVAEGDLEYQIPGKGLLCSEFHTLSASINQMTNKLYDSRIELDKYSNSLETLVAERTQELEDANRELESFSHSVSHDLRAPIRRIDGFSRILLDDYREQLDGSAVDYLHRVRNATLHMSELIESMLTLSRVTRSPMQYTHVCLSDIANEIIQQLRENEPQRSVDFKVEDNLMVYGDPILLMAFMENLIGNAWKYTSKKAHALIEIGVTHEEKPAFFIKDNGAGFNMEYIDNLFGTFQRLHKESDFSGTGVGLATVQRIINRHGGKIWAEAEVNAGATFYFTFPEQGITDKV